MKQLSIEEKAKAYDESIERAKVFKEHLLEINEKDYADEMDYIFPELAESKDEKIRKALMQNLKERFGTKGNMGEGLDMPDVLAWFEKQGEQKDILKDATLDNNEDGLITDTIKARGERKPTLDIEIPFGMDSELVEETMTIPKGCYAVIKDNKVVIRKGKKPTEWNEEDEKIFNFIGDMLSEAYEVTNRTNVLPFLQVRDWLLLHLRPQSQWKPSSEQIMYLRTLVGKIFPNTREYDALLSLLKQLEKL